VICKHCSGAFTTSRGNVFCSRACSNMHRHGRIEDRFWNYVQKTDTCWLWTGRALHQGYGQIAIGGPGRNIALAHRVSWFLAHGRWPTPCALHKCDNRRCVRPDHLFEGTVQDNNRDRDAKGRGRNNNAVGEASHLSKLTTAAVVKIREDYARGDTTLLRLAREHSVSTSSVSLIVRREIWRHI
jgi:hypothetical protein